MGIMVVSHLGFLDELGPQTSSKSWQGGQERSAPVKWDELADEEIFFA
jgi:hypothetical protein